MQKNIIFLTFLNLWSMDKGKGAPSFHKTIEAYLNDGWNVLLVNPKYGIGVSQKIEGLKNITFKPIFYPLVNIKKISFLGRIFHSIHGAYALKKIAKDALEEWNYKALIYAYEVHGVKAGESLKKEFGLPLVTRFQGTVLAPIKDNWLNRLKKYPHFDALKTKADITIMTNDGTQGDSMLKRLKNQSSQIKFWRNGVDVGIEDKNNETELYKIREGLGLYPSDKILITVSRLASWKKVNRAIEALAVVVKRDVNVKLVIVGDGDQKKDLMELAERLNLTSNIIFTGAVPQSNVRNYMEIADIFLSLYDLSNVGNPLLEAMSCGKPIITINVGDTGSLINNNENGILLELDQLEMIPEYIHKLLDNKSYAENLGNNARQFAREHFWSWADRMKAELDIVNKLYGICFLTS